MRLPRWWRRAWERIAPPRKLQVFEGDSLPQRLPRRDLVLARDGQEDWSVGMRCPCGCARRIELLVIPEAKPRWNLETDARGTATLSPSVWLKDGCRSHFRVRSGRVNWCD